jgi:pimeloyl-ACP methyl ester carboxylesterase
MFLLAGGPGQSATKGYALGPSDLWPGLFPGYTIVAYDVRGTGGSSPIHCQAGASAAACGRELGTDRVFYSTASNVMDLDAVRRALGVGRVGLLGTSYGTELALAYARAFPTHVARLVLDSIAEPLDTFSALSSVLNQLPVTLNMFCQHACGGITTNYGRDVVALANSLARKPLDAPVLQPDGRSRQVELDGTKFLDLVLKTDVDPSLGAVLPAAVHAARVSNLQPLLRLAEIEDQPPRKVEEYSHAVFLATVCNDGPFPWAPNTPLSERPLLLKHAFARLRSDAFGGFGAWASRLGVVDSCLGWPVSTVPYLSASARYPDVPVLVLAGQFDLRGTVPEARAVLAHFPHGRLLTVTNVGHSVIGSSSSTCLRESIQAWMAGRPIAATCEALRTDEPAGPYPSAAVPTGKAVSPLQLLSLATTTLEEAELMREVIWSSGATSTSVAGLESGRLDASPFGFTLFGYSIARGVTLTGKLAIEISANGSPAYAGSVRIGAAGAREGTLKVNGNVLNGSLEGRLVVASQLVPAAASDDAIARATSLWSGWTARPGTTLALAEAIEGHVSSQYVLDTTGTPLVEVTTGPISVFAPIEFIQSIPKTSSGRSGMVPQPAPNTWTYELCGRGADCSIPGTPTAVRGQLVRREALELALYTFKLLPTITAVLVGLPSPPGTAQVFALFPRSQFSRELAEPLTRTLPLAQPPVPPSRDATEQATIDKLTLRDLYTYYLSPDIRPRGTFTLVLTGLGQR